MTAGGQRRWFPRGLYGRAALILLLPIAAIQLVVSIVFIQRHFEDVTAQMTRSLAPTLRHLASEVESAPDAAAARVRLARLAPALDVEATLDPEAPVRAGRAFYDLSSRVVAATLREELGPAAVGPIDFGPPQRRVVFDLLTERGPMRVDFSRRRVSASNPHQLLVLMVAAGVVLSVVATFFLRAQLRPVRRLAEAAEAFGKGPRGALPPPRRDRGAPGGAGVSRHAPPDRAGRRAAHADAFGREPRPQDAADADAPSAWS